MKIVDNADKIKSTKFLEISYGDVFIVDEDVYMKASDASGNYAVNVKTGIVHTICYSQDVTPLPNAELHLNK